MKWSPKIYRAIRSLLKRNKLDAQMDEEMRLHVELRTQANIKSGMEPQEARPAALRQFGQADLFKERCRDARGFTWFEDLGKDLKFALRLLGKNPGFTAIAVGTLAIGIGAATAIYSVLDVFALHPLAGPYADRLCEIAEFNLRKAQQWRISPLLFSELTASYTNLFEKLSVYENDGLSFESGDFMKVMAGAKVAPGFFEVFGAQPILGRTFTQSEGTPGQDELLVISYSFWQNRFGGSKDVIGKTVRLLDKAWTIIGVMPKGFEFPERGTCYWRPKVFGQDQLAPVHRWQRDWWCIALRKPDVSPAQVQLVLRDLSTRLQRQYPQICEDWTIQQHSLIHLFVDASVLRTLWGVFGALGFLVAVICATIAGLQTARLESRQHELAVRASLGAGRWRLIRQLLIENLILAGAGGGLGLILSFWARGVCLRLVPEGAPMLKPLSFDWRITLLTLAVSVLLGVAFGILPAWAATRFSLAETIKQSGATATGGRLSRALRSGLVVGEVALTLVMVISASLLVRSVWKALEVDPGFEPRRLARVWVDYPQRNANDRQQRVASGNEIAERLRGLPGTIAVGIGDFSYSTDFVAEGSPRSSEISVTFVGIGTNDYFRAIGARLAAGHWFDASDDSEGQNTILVNETLARSCWPGQGAIGKHLWMGKADEAKTNSMGKLVIGVVHDTRDWSYLSDPKPMLFEPFSRDFMSMAGFWIRTRLDHASFLSAVRTDVKQVLPRTMEPGVSWVAQDLYASTGGKRLYAVYLSALAGVGLLLAALGIYGVLSYMVARRIREIGVRMALGAQRQDVIKLIVSQGARLTAFGILSGAALAYIVTRILRNQLFGVGPSDPVAWLGAGAVLLLAGLLASYLPARRATKVDPLAALRHE